MIKAQILEIADEGTSFRLKLLQEDNAVKRYYTLADSTADFMMAGGVFHVGDKVRVSLVTMNSSGDKRITGIRKVL